MTYPDTARQEYLYTSRREMADHVFPIADHLGLPLSDAAIEQQRLVAGCVALIDYMWDNDPASHAPFLQYCQELESIGTEAQPPQMVHPQVAEDLNALMDSMDPLKIPTFFAMGRTAVSLAGKYKATTNPAHFMHLRAHEARCSGHMMTSAMPRQDRDHSAYPRYAELVGEIMVARNAADTLRDLRSDYRTGETQLRPTALNRGVVAVIAARDIGRCCAMLGPRLSATMLGVTFAHSQARRRIKPHGNEK